MSWHFLPELEAEFLVESSVDSEPCAPLKSTPSVGRCCFDARWMDTYRASLSGMTSRPSTGGPGAGSLISLPEVFRVRTSALRDVEQVSAGSEAVSGARWPAPLVRYDRDMCSWKTAQLSLLVGLESFSETWPRWGMMRDGECWERVAQVPHNHGNAAGLWHTPRCQASGRLVKIRTQARARGGDNGNLEEQVAVRMGVDHGYLNPAWLEWLMG